MRSEEVPHTAPSKGIACMLAAPLPAHTGGDRIIRGEGVSPTIMAQPMANATKEGGSAADGAAASRCCTPEPHAAERDTGKVANQLPLLSRMASWVAAAASAPKVVGYRDLDLSGPVWAAWVRK